MFRKMGSIKALGLSAACIMTSQALAASRPRGVPTYEALLEARSKVDAMIGHVQEVLNRYENAGGEIGDGSGGGEFPHNPQLFGVREELENDQAASFALVGLGSGLQTLGVLVDQATAAYNTPSFFLYKNQACVKASFLLGGAKAGKVTAALPVTNLITPFDFQATEIELQDVKNLLICF